MLEFCGIEWKYAPNTCPDCVKPLYIASSNTGYPSTVIRPDGKWLRYCREVDDIDLPRVPEVIEPIKNLRNGVLLPEANWSLSGGQAPTIFSFRALEKQLEFMCKPAGQPEDWEAFLEATGMLSEMLMYEIGSFRRLSLQEAIFGTDDGKIAGIPLDTASGFGLHKIAKKKRELFENHMQFVVNLLYEDYARVKNVDRPLWSWPHKGSLKDARLELEKIAEEKARVFMAANTIPSITGRRVIGDFIRKFNERCAKGGFMGIVGFVLARGGWHSLMEDLTHEFTRDEIDDFDIKRYDKDFIRLIHFYVIKAICEQVPYDHAQEIWRHYERVVWSPAFMAMIGALLYQPRGQMSGDIATVIINTLAQALIYMYLYCKNVPREERTYQKFKNMITLKLLGDDSASTRDKLFDEILKKKGETWMSEVVHVFKEFGWDIESPRNPPGPAHLEGDFTFVGHQNQRVEVPLYDGSKKVFYLPRLPFNVVLSINEWKKLPKSPETPEQVRDLARYYATFERALPYLWSDNKLQRQFVRVALRFLDRVRRDLLTHDNPVIRKTAEGVPTVHDLVKLYFPPGVNSYEITRGIQRLLQSDPEQG